MSKNTKLYKFTRKKTNKFLTLPTLPSPSRTILKATVRLIIISYLKSFDKNEIGLVKHLYLI
jgi:hypothetical protein